MLKVVKLAALILCIDLLVTPAHATDLFVNPTTGSDGNSCESKDKACKTVNHACAIFPSRHFALIHLADGLYTETHCDIQHFSNIAVVGNVKSPQNVILEAPGGNIFAVQDHATFTLQGVTLRTSSGGKKGGATGILNRQFSISDIYHVAFGNISVGVVASEMSKINCLGDISVSGKIERLFSATGASTANVACDVTFKRSPNITYLYYAIQESRIEANGATFIGFANIAYRYLVSHSTIYLPKIIPGSAEVSQNGASVF